MLNGDSGKSERIWRLNSTIVNKMIPIGIEGAGNDLILVWTQKSTKCKTMDSEMSPESYLDAILCELRLNFDKPPQLWAIGRQLGASPTPVLSLTDGDGKFSVRLINYGNFFGFFFGQEKIVLKDPFLYVFCFFFGYCK